MLHSVLIALAYGLPVVAILVSVAIGFREVRVLRRETGDQSKLTALLGWEFGRVRHCGDDA